MDASALIRGRTLRPARAATLAGLTALYLAAGKLGLSLALVHASASAVWPPTGIALAAFLLLGGWVWPAILAGAFLVNLTTEGNAATSLGIAIGNTAEGLAGAFLVRRFAGGTAAFDRPRHVIRFMLLAGFVATTISPSAGVTSLCLGGFARWEEYAGIWLTWWLGDAGGAMVVAPALILWGCRPRPDWIGLQRLEVGALLVAIAAVGSIAFGGLAATPGGGQALSFLCLPLTIWTAFRFGPRETATAVLMLSGMAVWGTLRLAGASPGEQENQLLLLLQLFMGVVAVTSLSLAAVVSERRRTLDELERQAGELARSNAELDDFAHAVSHDLKAPLWAISSLATWIEEDCGALLPAESRQQLSILQQRARRMSRLIDGVLSYSRVGRRDSAVGRVDSRAVVQEVVAALGPLDGVAVRIEHGLPVVHYDRVQLTQVFQNLIQNALQHRGRPSGEIAIACVERPGAFEFSVRDDGVGIAESHMERLFQMFDAADPDGESSGMGLSIVKRIVETNGGAISAESTAGRGATFRFSVPRTARHQKPISTPKVRPWASPNWPKRPSESP